MSYTPSSETTPRPDSQRQAPRGRAHERNQFRILYREFLFRLTDIELLSPQALGDSNKLVGQFASLLIFISILLAVPALGTGDRHTPPALRLFYAWSAEHVLIATTMLVVGLFAVLSWDSVFPEKRDVLVLGPLPLRARTLFLAKVAAVAAALGLTVLSLHSLAGFAWPLGLGTMGTLEMRVPALGYLAAEPPADPVRLASLLNRDLPSALAPETGLAIGIVKNGERRILTYGTARPDSLYQIASISKTFRVSEKISGRFSADAFNVLNHPNFSNPSNVNIDNTSGLLGNITSLTGNNRIMQFNVRMQF